MALIMLMVLLLTGCGGRSITNGEVGDHAVDFELIILEDTYIEGGSAAGFKLSQQLTGDEIQLEIAVTRAENLKALICEISYDPLQFDPLSVEMTGALDPGGGEVIDKALAIDVDPGRVCYGQILPRPQERDGFYGDATLAIARFLRQPDHALKASSAAPLNRRSQTPLNWDAESGKLSWHYYSSGDFNQDSYVGVADITPIGTHWKQQSGGGPFPDSDSASVVDYDNNGEINGADMSALSRYYSTSLKAYHVYTSLDSADYPTSPTAPNGPGAVLLGTVDFINWVTNPDYARRYFEFTVPDPQTDAYYWIRPVDNTEEGIPSTLAGGPPE